jgi:hypothetical protein
MAFTLLFIRLKQLQRELKGLGLYGPIVIAIVCFLSFASLKQFQHLQSAYYLVAAITLIAFALQYYRKDKLFIYKHVENPHLQMFSEYVALALPFCVPGLFTVNWICFPALMLLLFCIPFLKFSFSQKVVFKNLSSIIPATNFEWIAGIRKNYLSLIGLYLLATAFCWFRILPLFLLWLLTVMVISFHSECESIQVLRGGDKSPQKYVMDKLKTNSLFIAILYLPLLIINTIFNSEFLVINTCFFASQFFLVSFAICFKYSLFKPSKNLIGNSIALTIFSVCSALPWFFPVTALLSIFYFNKAVQNLKEYLND